MGNTFGSITKALRLKAGITLIDLAARIGSNKGYVSGIENGKVNPPTVKFVRKIHKALAPTLAHLGIKATAEDFVELAEVDKMPQFIRERMRRRIADNPLAAAYVSTTAPEIRPSAPVEKVG